MISILKLSGSGRFFRSESLNKTKKKQQRDTIDNKSLALSLRMQIGRARDNVNNRALTS